MTTPLSPSYSRHASRGLILWLLLLPGGLLAGGCNSLLKLLIVTVSNAYIMLGIDEIGIQLEQPFEILPLVGLSSALTRDVVDELLPHDV